MVALSDDLSIRVISAFIFTIVGNELRSFLNCSNARQVLMHCLCAFTRYAETVSGVNPGTSGLWASKNRPCSGSFPPALRLQKCR